MNKLWQSLGALIHRREFDRDLDGEIRAHLALEARQRIDTGQSPEEAWAAARRDFGNVVMVKEVTRDLWGWTALERIGQDLRYAWRMLWKSPGFTLAALGALTLGIGASTAIFTVVNSVLIRPLPYPDPDRLVMVRETTPQGRVALSIQTQNFLDWRSRNRSLERIAAIHQIPMNLTGAGDPEQVIGLRVSADFFPVLGVPPLMGRPIQPEEDVSRARSSVVLSHGLWLRRFGGDPNVLGKTISVNGAQAEIVGVMPARFALPNLQAELFVPIQIDPATAPQEGRNYLVVARLRKEVALQAALEDMKRIAAQTAAERPAMNAKWSATVIPLKEDAVGQTRTVLLVLLGAVGFVLLLAGANVANLLLMRAAGRTREIAVRLALGAGRWRLAHQLLVESLLLAALGGLFGFALALAGVRAILAMLPATFPLPRMAEISLDGSILAFSLIVSLGAGLVFGLTPALHAGSRSLSGRLHQGGRAGVGGGRRLRNALVVAEVSLALLLVCGAGLMIRSFSNLNRVDPGFRVEKALTTRMLLLPSKYRELNRRAAFIEQTLERIRALPQVTAAGSIHLLPLSGVNSGTPYYRTDHPAPPPGAVSGGDVSVVSSGYFRAMGIPLLMGRDFDSRDRIGSPGVGIINETFAKREFPVRIRWENDCTCGGPAIPASRSSAWLPTCTTGAWSSTPSPACSSRTPSAPTSAVRW